MSLSYVLEMFTEYSTSNFFFNTILKKYSPSQENPGRPFFRNPSRSKSKSSPTLESPVRRSGSKKFYKVEIDQFISKHCPSVPPLSQS